MKMFNPLWQIVVIVIVEICVAEAAAKTKKRGICFPNSSLFVIRSAKVMNIVKNNKKEIILIK